jgi:SAM-dependent methyltransferase
MLDPFIMDYYENGDESGRLYNTVYGRLVRLRTWDIFERYLPEPTVAPRVIDIGGGSGVHAAYLAERGYEVTLVDPVPSLVKQALSRAATGASDQRFRAEKGDARQLEFEDESFDIALLMGPLYHLANLSDRNLALAEAKRVLRPGGVLFGEIMTRRNWLIAATIAGFLKHPGIFDDFEINEATGLPCERTKFEATGGGFWAYYHDIDEVVPELSIAGFTETAMVAVEGFAWVIGNPGLDTLLSKYQQELLRAVAMTERDPHLLGVSQHIDVIARRT